MSQVSSQKDPNNQISQKICHTYPPHGPLRNPPHCSPRPSNQFPETHPLVVTPLLIITRSSVSQSFSAITSLYTGCVHHLVLKRIIRLSHIASPNTNNLLTMMVWLSTDSHSHPNRFITNTIINSHWPVATGTPRIQRSYTFKGWMIVESTHLTMVQ